tara:strand:- start:642 stop:1010 length:369 start_codon:yes stop_codon:yes gene_type:complete
MKLRLIAKTRSEFTEQDYRTAISNTTPSQAGSEAMERLGANNGWSRDAIDKLIDEVWAGRNWICEDQKEIRCDNCCGVGTTSDHWSTAYERQECLDNNWELNVTCECCHGTGGIVVDKDNGE